MDFKIFFQCQRFKVLMQSSKEDSLMLELNVNAHMLTNSLFYSGILFVYQFYCSQSINKMRVFLPQFVISPQTQKQQSKQHREIHHPNFIRRNHFKQKSLKTNIRFNPKEMINKHKSLMLGQALTCKKISMFELGFDNNSVMTSKNDLIRPIHSREKSNIFQNTKKKKVPRLPIEHKTLDFGCFKNIKCSQTARGIKGMRKTIQAFQFDNSPKKTMSNKSGRSAKLKEDTVMQRNISRQYRPWSPHKLFFDEVQP